MRAARILAGSLLAFLLVEVLIFDTNVYPSVLKPDSSAGMLETFLHNERRRNVVNRNQVLAIGDSRMGFIPRYPNKLDKNLYRVEVYEQIDNGQYSISPNGSSTVFCFEVY